MTMRNPERHPPSRASSSFSNKSLTLLESLVLEIALEDANQLGGCSVKDCEMSAADCDKITRLPGNDCCADCQSPDTEWASVTFGILLCAACSGVHRAMGTHISRVRSIKMDNWSQDHLEIMRVGGNRSCRRYLESKGVDLNQEIPAIYSSEAATDYKKLLQDKVLKKQERLDETESSSNTEHDGSVDAPIVGGSKIAIKHVDSILEDESCASFAGESVVEANNKHDRSPTEKVVVLDDSVVETERGARTTSGESSLSLMSLDAWFGAVRSKSSFHNTNGLVVQSTHSGSRQRVRRNFSSSTPTITYLGRSFAADKPHDDSLSDSKHKMRNQSDPKLLAELAEQQEAVARENLNDSWRWEIPSTSCRWFSDKKVEPFDTAMEKGYSHASSHSTGSAIPPHYETMRRKLSYTDADLLRIVKDDKEFARLKAGLKSKGAITNEMLKQKLHAFVVKSKLRNASTESPGKSENQRSQDLKSTNNSKDRKSKTIHTNTFQRG